MAGRRRPGDDAGAARGDAAATSGPDTAPGMASDVGEARAGVAPFDAEPGAEPTPSPDWPALGARGDPLADGPPSAGPSDQAQGPAPRGPWVGEPDDARGVGATSPGAVGPAEDAAMSFGRPDLGPPDLSASPPSPEETPRLVIPGQAAEASGASIPSSAAPRPDPAIAPSMTPRPPRRGGAWALLLGGALAAAMGFAAAWLARGTQGETQGGDVAERLAALEARPAGEAGNEELAGRLTDAEARLSALEAEAEALAAVPAGETAAVTVDLGPVEAALAEAEAQAGDLETRLAALEAAPPPVAGGGEAEVAQGSPATPALDEGQVAAAAEAAAEAAASDAVAGLEGRVAEAEAALSALDARLGEAEAESAAATEAARRAEDEAAAVGARAAEAAADAEARAALAALAAALDAGEPFADALDALGRGGLDPPEGLAGLAAEGAPTLAALREGFPAAAREGLAAARGAGLVDEGGGVGAFLRRQLGIRSVTPREGSDPDAVLSRAEGALGQGRLDQALAAVAGLPEPARQAMAGWIAQAEARAAADAGLAQLRDALPET